MPVLPEVGSTSVVLPGVMSPRASASAIMAYPIRSLTEPSGLKNSSFREQVGFEIVVLRPSRHAHERRSSDGV